MFGVDSYFLLIFPKCFLLQMMNIHSLILLIAFELLFLLIHVSNIVIITLFKEHTISNICYCVVY